MTEQGRIQEAWVRSVEAWANAKLKIGVLPDDLFTVTRLWLFKREFVSVVMRRWGVEGWVVHDAIDTLDIEFSTIKAYDGTVIRVVARPPR